MYPWMQRGSASSKKGLKKFSSIKKEEVKSIAVIRHAALGDMMQTRPFLLEIKKCFPNAKITLSLASHYQYAAPVDLVDRVHIMHGQDRRHLSLFERYKNIKELGEHDLLFDLACTTRSHLLSFLTKAKLKLSFPYKNWRFIYDVNLFRSDLNFEAEILLEFLHIFGHNCEFPLNFSLPKHNLSEANKEICYFISSADPEKNYRRENFIELMKLMATKYPDYKHSLLQGKGEHEKFLDVYEELKTHSNISLVETKALEELIQYFSKVRLVVANDTGVRHVAISTHTPTVGFFSTTVPYRSWPRYEPQHYAVLSKYGEHAPAQEVAHLIESLIKKS